MGQHKYNPRVQMAKRGELPTKEEERAAAWRAAHPGESPRLSKATVNALSFMAALNMAGKYGKWR